MKYCRQRIFLSACTLVLAIVPGIAHAQGGGSAPVRAAEVTLQMLAPTITLPATVVSRDRARMSAEVAGAILEVSEIGERVEAGNPVVRIDSTILELTKSENESLVERERARIAYLERELGRLERLAAQNNAAKSRLDEVASDLSVARNELGAARSRLEQVKVALIKTKMPAPFSGIVTERFVNAGERVSIGDPVVRLVNPDRLEVVARAPLRTVRYVEVKDALNLKGDLHGGMGTVRTKVPFGDDRSSMFELRLDVPPDQWTIGENVRLEVPTAEATEVLAVPRDALVLRREGTAVYRIKDDMTAERIDVVAGAASGELVAIRGDVNVGDRVIVRGAERLRPGQTVQIIDEARPEAATGAQAGSQ